MNIETREVDFCEIPYKLSDCKVRDLGVPGTSPIITGYAAKFNSLSEELGYQIREKIAPGAFARSLETIDENNVFLLNQHNYEQPIASTDSGTLTLLEDEQGLKFEARPTALPSWTVDTLRCLKANLISKMSFGFYVVEEEWDTRGSLKIRTVNELELLEVSIVTRPAYTATDVEVKMRSFSKYCENNKELMEQMEKRQLEIRKVREIARKNSNK